MCGTAILQNPRALPCRTILLLCRICAFQRHLHAAGKIGHFHLVLLFQFRFQRIQLAGQYFLI